MLTLGFSVWRQRVTMYSASQLAPGAAAALLGVDWAAALPARAMTARGRENFIFALVWWLL